MQVGTRFIATRECVAHRTYKAAIAGAEVTGTSVVSAGRFRLRALKTRLGEEGAGEGAGLVLKVSTVEEMVGESRP